jgi:hypothetical protein
VPSALAGIQSWRIDNVLSRLDELPLDACVEASARGAAFRVAGLLQLRAHPEYRLAKAGEPDYV